MDDEAATNHTLFSKERKHIMKDFTKAPKTSTILDDIQAGSLRSTKQQPASIEEQEARGNAMQTQGRRGCKLTRYNLGLTPANLEFVNIVSRVKGQSKNEFINHVINAYRESHPDLLAKAKDFIENY